MFFKAATISAFAALVGLASAVSTVKRTPGPSGSVLTPAGGANIDSTEGYPTGKIDFSYQPVYISKSSNCAYYECTAQTWYVSVGLQDSTGKTTMLANSLGGNNVDSVISATLVVPANFCGKYNLVVQEYQNLYGNTINFQSAAPQINIECDPLP